MTGAWRLIFNDRFAGSQLDTSRWSTGWFGAGITVGPNSAERECDDPAQVTVANGLHIAASARSERCGGQLESYVSGLISTNGKFQFTYGYVAARIRLSSRDGHIADWPAFWADGQVWPQDGELDVMEGIGGQACWHFHSGAAAPGGCPRLYRTLSGWHTYAADWEPGRVVYYYDGRRVGEVSSGITSQPMYLILDLAVSQEYAPPEVAPAHMDVAWVRVWQR